MVILSIHVGCHLGETVASWVTLVVCSSNSCWHHRPTVSPCGRSTTLMHRRDICDIKKNINAAIPGRFSLHFFFVDQASHLKLKHLCFSPFKSTASDASCLISCVSGGRKWASQPAHQAGGLEFEHLTLRCQSSNTRQERGERTEIWHSNRGGKCCTGQPQMCRTKQRAASRR